jgi:hypothetical protein
MCASGHIIHQNTPHTRRHYPMRDDSSPRCLCFASSQSSTMNLRLDLPNRVAAQMENDWNRGESNKTVSTPSDSLIRPLTAVRVTTALFDRRRCVGRCSLWRVNHSREPYRPFDTLCTGRVDEDRQANDWLTISLPPILLYTRKYLC